MSRPKLAAFRNALLDWTAVEVDPNGLRPPVTVLSRRSKAAALKDARDYIREHGSFFTVYPKA
jgi:hypothetical protein